MEVWEKLKKYKGGLFFEDIEELQACVCVFFFFFLIIFFFGKGVATVFCVKRSPSLNSRSNFSNQKSTKKKLDRLFGSFLRCVGNALHKTGDLAWSCGQSCREIGFVLS